MKEKCSNTLIIRIVNWIKEFYICISVSVIIVENIIIENSIGEKSNQNYLLLGFIKH